MKYISEITGKTYNTQEDCLAAEKAFNEEKAKKEKAEQELKNARASRAKEVEKAYAKYVEAYEKYVKLRNEFVKDYKSFHMTYTNNSPLSAIFDLLNF